MQSGAAPNALLVHSKLGLHPAAWKAKLKKLDLETHDLVSWVSRSEDWYILEAGPDHVPELMRRIKPLRKLGLTVKVRGEESHGDPDPPKKSASVCADHLAGRQCEHEKPYCN